MRASEPYVVVGLEEGADLGGVVAATLLDFEDLGVDECASEC